MNLEKRLSRWVTAQLISPEQSKQILRYEREQPSASWVLFGISGIGVIVVLTGIISIIAANWNEIPTGVKLGLYFLSLITLGGVVFWRRSNPGIVQESLYAAFALYVLAGIGLIGQIYNLESDGYQAIFFWLLLVLPITLQSNGRLLNNLWFLGLAAGLTSWGIIARDEIDAAHRGDFALGLTYAFLGLGYGAGHILPTGFCATVRLWAYSVLLVGFGTLANMIWSVGTEKVYYMTALPFPTISVVGAALALLGALSRTIQPGQLRTYAIVTTVITSAVFIITPFAIPLSEHRIIGCMLFLLMWSGAAAVAAANERKRLFDAAASIIGIRFVIIYFEVFGSLAATGIGLIISGAVILWVASLWHRYRSKLALLIQEKV